MSIFDQIIADAGAQTIGQCTVANEPPSLAEAMLNRRIQGKTWGEIADEFGFPNPSAARKAFTKHTGITDYKIKGKELQDIVNKGLVDTIKGTVEKKAKKAVEAVDDALNIARKGPDVFDFQALKDEQSAKAAAHMGRVFNDPLIPDDKIFDVIRMNNEGKGYLAISQKTGITIADVDNIVWNNLVGDFGGDVWKAYVSKPTSENGFKAVKELVFELRSKGMTAAEVSKISGVDEKVVKMIVDGNWSLPSAGSKTYVSIVKPTYNPSYTGSSGFNGSYGGTKYIAPEYEPPKYPFGWDPYDPLTGATGTNFPTKTVDEMNTWHHSLPSLPEDQRQALRSYTGSGYHEMNDYLRGKSPTLSESAAARIPNIDATMQPLPSAQRVFRGVDRNVFQGEDPSTLVGSVFKDNGYMSATNDPKGGFTSKEIYLMIDLPAGTPVRWLMPFSGFASEKELLIGRATNFLVKSVEPKPGGGLIVHLEAILT